MVRSRLTIKFKKMNKSKKIKPENAQLTTREQRRQIRLDKAAARYAKALRRGEKRARYY